MPTSISACPAFPRRANNDYPVCVGRLPQHAGVCVAALANLKVRPRSGLPTHSAAWMPPAWLCRLYMSPYSVSRNFRRADSLDLQSQGLDRRILGSLKKFHFEVPPHVCPAGGGLTVSSNAQPDCGEATVAGACIKKSPAQVRRLIGVVAQNSGVDINATGRWTRAERLPCRYPDRQSDRLIPVATRAALVDEVPPVLPVTGSRM